MRTKAKVIIVHDEHFLLLKPLKKKKYTLIGGTANKNELAAIALIREANEEAGIHVEMKDLKFFHSCKARIADKDYQFECFLIEGIDLLFELQEKEKFKYVDWIPQTKALEKLRGIEKNLVSMYLLDKEMKQE
jgi:ADP-ribose pyrophosphatase YjhB (NUDIX family)